MEQTKALNALEPFLALSKSATSPRAAADLVTRATSAANTFLFAELLQTPQIQALAAAPEFASHLTLLQIFSYGTCETYHATPNLPALSDAQTLKLRQLSLLTLARDRSNLSYDALQKALGLPSARDVENLVITAVYADLLHATLDPARQTVQVTSVAPLRDLPPGSIPDMTAALKTWSSRCTTTLGELDEQMKNIRATAAVRETKKRAADDKLQYLVAEMRESGDKHELAEPGRGLPPRRGFNKRGVSEAGKAFNDETMDVDEPVTTEDQKKRAGKRKM